MGRDRLKLMNHYDKLPTATLKFLYAICLAVHHAGEQTMHSQEEFRAIKAELFTRQSK